MVYRPQTLCKDVTGTSNLTVLAFCLPCTFMFGILFWTEQVMILLNQQENMYNLLHWPLWPELFTIGCIKQASNWLKSQLKQASFQTECHSSSYWKSVRFTADAPHLRGSVSLYLNVCVCINKTHHVHPGLTDLANELFVQRNVVFCI